MHAIAAVFLSAFTMGATGAAPQGELLDFTAKWCGPCQQMSPLVDRLHRQGYPIRKVDIDENRELARQFGIQSIPAFVLVINGRVVEQSAGLQSEARLLQMLSRIPKPQPVPEFDAAKSAPLVLAESRGTASRSATTMVTGQPAVSTNSQTPVITASQKKPAAPNRGLLGLNLLGTKSKAETSLKKSTPAVVRANLEDTPLVDADILTQDPMVASTRIRVSDKEGVNLGSGTIVESKVGQSLILTCGHLFRKFQADSSIEVDIFLNGKSETFVGKLVKHDLESDLGVISIPTDNPLPFAAIADSQHKAVKGTAVQSVGCGQGNAPSLQKHMVTQMNRYTGPENVECTGVPVLGRSGGGLFNMQGQLVGVCMAADTKERRGLYSGLGAIHDFLRKIGLTRVLPERDGMEEPVLADDPETLLVKQDKHQRPSRGIAALQAALVESGSDDVVCLVRTNRSAQSEKRVLVLTGKPVGE